MRTEDIVTGVHEASWQSLWTLMHGEGTDVTSLGARIAVLCFAFSALILGSSYTANLAAFLTIQQMSSISNIYDLTGLAIMTVDTYVERLRQQYPITPGVFNVSSIDDVFDIGREIIAGKYRAFLYDAEVLQYVVAMYPSCGLRLLPETYQPFDYGLAFAANTSSRIIDGFSLAILRQQESGVIERFREEYMMLDSPCLSVSSTVSVNDLHWSTFTSVLINTLHSTSFIYLFIPFK